MPGAPRRGGGGGERRERRDDRRGGQAEKQNVYLERVVTINRVAKVVKGGRRFSFTALVVVGDGNGMVGVGYGKAKEVPAAIAKGVEEAKKHFFRVPRIATTIPHTVQGEAAAGVVLLSRPEEIAAKRGLPIEDVAPKAMLQARAAATAGAASQGGPR